MEPIGRELAEHYAYDLSQRPQGDLPAHSEDLFTAPPEPTPAPNTAPSEPARQPDPAAERWIQVDLTNQYMIAWQGEVRVIESDVSTGRDQFASPPGTYQIIRKTPVEDMSGVIGGEYYHVEDVPHALYFTNVGHAFHGMYWHTNFGTPMSHGCINLPLDVAEQLYNWVSLGVRVEIHY